MLDKAIEMRLLLSPMLDKAIEIKDFFSPLCWTRR